MPEIPDLEAIRHYLMPRLDGLTVSSTDAPIPWLVRTGTEGLATLQGRRFGEFHRLGNYKDTMYLCHNSIARAMYFTTMIVVAGFSILVLSNFIPTIVFGLLTSIAMMVALLGALTLLPQLSLR